MFNLLISLAAGVLVAVAIKLAGFSIWAGLLPGALVFVGVYIVLARRTAVQVQALMTAAQAELQGNQPTSQRELTARIDRAVKMLEGGLHFGKWQFLVEPEIHAQMGMLRYLGKDMEAARTHLAKSSARNYMAKAFEGALHYQRKDTAAMTTAFEAAVKAGKKEAIVWAAYAWCLVQIGKKDAALGVLARAVQANPTDEKLKGSLAQLQNDKRLKMKPYEPLWWNFGLEAPPPQFVGGPRVRFQRR